MTGMGGGRSREAKPEVLADVIQLGVDVGLKRYAVCRQVDHSLQDPPRMMGPEAFLSFALQQRNLAQRVVLCYEASVFGFELARWAQENSIEAVVMAPVKLDEANTRVETDKLNARDICGRLDRYLCGNLRALSPCRIPSRQEELDRSQTRQRDQLQQTRNRLVAQGRCLLWQFGMTGPESHSWWKPAIWESLVIDPVLRENLHRFRQIILEVQEQLRELNAQLYSQAKEQLPIPMDQLPRGVGWLSLLALCREIMDWKRFSNRRQVGCLTGLVPSEASTGLSRRTGSVTKVGNPRIRRLLVEMAWRMVRYQPRCRAIAPWIKVLTKPKQSKVVRKRAIVACARRLAIDLWRLITHQTTPQALGFNL
jgi:transposase